MSERRKKEDPGSEERAAKAPGGEAPAESVAEKPEAPESPASASAEDAPAIDFRDRWLRSEADFQNYRRRAQRDLEETRRGAEERVMLEIIGALDDLERAISSAAAAGAPESWTSGVQLVANRLGEYLARQGVTVVDPLGAPFDPEFHEALIEVEREEGAAPGSVVQVVLKGYRRGARALRAARVVVAKRPSGSGA